jgi:hypothetical protein
MFVRVRVPGFGSSVNKEFQKKKLDNSKTMIYSHHLKGTNFVTYLILVYFSLTLPLSYSGSPSAVYFCIVSMV